MHKTSRSLKAISDSKQASDTLVRLMSRTGKFLRPVAYELIVSQESSLEAELFGIRHLRNFFKAGVRRSECS